MSYKKINVIGTSGSGKSTFAKKLAKKLDLKYVEFDLLFWKSNWTEATDEELFSKLKNQMECGIYVLDGNYPRTTDLKWKDIDLVVWIDLPFYKTVIQATKRAFKRAITQQELWVGTGNRESFRRTFLSKDSVLLWTIQSYKRNKEYIESVMSDPKYSHINFKRFKSHKESQNFIDSL